MPRGTDMARLRQDLATAGARLMSAAAGVVRDVLDASIDGGFRQGRDVYGRAFKPAKDGHLPPMIRSGKLRRAIKVEIVPSPAEWLVTASEDTDYGQYLRDGTFKMDQRRFIPAQTEALPAAWDRRIQSGLRRAVSS